MTAKTEQTKTPDAIQTVLNQHAITLAEQQFRLASLFTPYGFDPERVDFDRVATFMDDPYQAFPQPTESMRASLDRIVTNATTARITLEAFAAQGATPTLDDDQLFMTAKANVTNPRGYRAAA